MSDEGAGIGSQYLLADLKGKCRDERQGQIKRSKKIASLGYREENHLEHRVGCIVY